MGLLQQSGRARERRGRCRFFMETNMSQAKANKTIKYYWEDLHAGQTIELGSVTVEREEALAFAGRYDPQPFHLDDEAAAQSIFGRLATSGWHTCSMAMGLMVRNFLLESSSLGSPGLESCSGSSPCSSATRSRCVSA
jgi:acyl dehydratase